MAAEGCALFVRGRLPQRAPQPTLHSGNCLSMPYSAYADQSVFRERSGEAPFSKRRHSNAFVVSLPGWKQVVQAAPAFNPQGILRISRHWPLQSMAANGRRQNRRQQVRAGSACTAAASGCRQRRLIIRREFCGFEETSRSNLWRLISCSVRRQPVRAGSACPA